VKLLSQSGAPAFFPMSYMIAGDPLADDSFTIAEKYRTLSSGIAGTQLGTTIASGYDVSFVTGYGPFAIPANGSVKVAFAFVAGDSPEDLRNQSATALNKYVLLRPEEQPAEVASLDLITYPNPYSEGPSSLRLMLPEQRKITLALYNAVGQRVRSMFSNQEFSKGVHQLTYNLSDLPGGIYFYHLDYGNQRKSVKVSVIK
jgi:serine protease